GELLPLSLSEIYDRLRDFFVYLDNSPENPPEIRGVCALHFIWEDLAEIRSLAVHEDFRKRGIGSQLVNACLKEAGTMDVKRIFCLTYNKKFFSLLGFRQIDKSELPHKVWADCIKCSKFPDCAEIAMIYDHR
ncbi:MAG: N-acetyltransferase, partial [bacterium]